MRRAALDAQSYVVAPNVARRHGDATPLHGRSLVCDPWGRVAQQVLTVCPWLAAAQAATHPVAPTYSPKRHPLARGSPVGSRGATLAACVPQSGCSGACALVPVWCLPEVADSSASNHHTPCLRFQVVAQCDPVGDAVVLAEVEPRVIADTRRKLPIFELAHPFE